MSSNAVTLNSDQTYSNTKQIITAKTTVSVDLDSISTLDIENSGTLKSTGKRAIDATASKTAATISGASLTINNTGTLSGSDDGIRIDADMPSATIVLTNSGTITSTTDGQAIDFNALTTASSITITNEKGGVIQSTDADAIRPGENAVINNAGTIYAGGANGATKNDGIDFQDDAGTVNNSGSISGARHGITSSTDVVVVNEEGGEITGRDGSGVGSDGTGSVTNYGTITGAYDQSGTGDGDGVDIDGYATIDNYGTIQGTGAGGSGSDGFTNTSEGLALGGGSITNHAGATISGAQNGILIDNSSQGYAPYATTLVNNGTIQGLDGYGIRINDDKDDTLTNSGTISGTTDAILLGDGNDTLNIQTGSVIIGTVDGGGGTNTLNLSGSGTFDGAQNFQTMTVAGAWTLSGNQSYQNITITSGASLVLAGTAPATETITFSDNTGKLTLQSASTFSATLANFSIGNTLTLSTLTNDGNATLSVLGNTATVTDNQTTYTLTFSASDLSHLTLGKTDEGAVMLEAVVCFLNGTLIETEAGLTPVENIRIGDQVMTYDTGRAECRAVIWAGKRPVTVRADLPADEAGYPVRILKNALADNVPFEDLLVTPEHCLYFDGQFVPVRMLVNGASIFYDRSLPQYECFHIETAQHAVIRANGALTESYLDTGNRRSFSQPGTLARLPSTPKTWEQDSAAPLTVARTEVERLFNLLFSRAQTLGLQPRQTTRNVTHDADLHLLTPAGTRLRALRKEHDRSFFLLPPGITTVSLVCRSARLADSIGPFVDDRRTLGVLVGTICCSEYGQSHDITPHLTDSPLSGWHTQENEYARWTDGCATLPLAPESGAAVGRILTIQILSAGPYVLDAETSSGQGKTVFSPQTACA
ncbi:Hint domain-containing protein [Acetobacter persici]|uniref:Hint domain-containing protein n=1 Tax=Acetobacter persici TaxID=1076596 RepID=UPI0039EAD795